MRCQAAVILGITLISFLVTIPGQADEFTWSKDRDLVGHFPIGYCFDATTQDNLVYYTQGPSLQIADISDPSNPLVLGWAYGNVRDIQVRGDYAYVAGDGLGIYDVSDPASPFLVGQLYDGQSSNKIAVSGNYAYMAYGTGGIKIVDISNSSMPVEVSSYIHESNEYVHDLAVNGNFMYVAYSWAGLRIVDISEPTAPVEVGYFESGESYKNLDVQWGYAYVVAPNDLVIISIGLPSDPVEIGRYSSPNFEPDIVAVSGIYAYLRGKLNSSISMFQVVNISNPAAPSALGSYTGADYNTPANHDLDLPPV